MLLHPLGRKLPSTINIPRACAFQRSPPYRATPNLLGFFDPGCPWVEIEDLALCASFPVNDQLELRTAVLEDEKSSFHGHSALYWAIVNDLGSPMTPFELIGAMVTNSQPLKPETIKDARRACISLRNQEMFQFLRMCPEFGALPAEDRFLLGLLVPPEDIAVEIMEGSEQPFSVNFHIPMFQKRMLLNKEIRLEFIARDRLWRLSFFTPAHPSLSAAGKADWSAKDKKWGAFLKLSENSQSTPVDVGLVLVDTRTTAPKPAHVWKHLWPQLPLRNEDDSASESTGNGWMWPMFNDYNGAQA
ncbi:hypothetical protein B0H19DRAFT_1274113 [Mycena capillaripes]|nr:hypothetical protein B0H19DRAFT_1274113 [Mycena capillaripes]